MFAKVRSFLFRKQLSIAEVVWYIAIGHFAAWVLQ